MLFARRVAIALIVLAVPLWTALTDSPAPPAHSGAPEPSGGRVAALTGIWEHGPDLETALPEAVYQEQLAEEARIEAERLEAERLAAELAARRARAAAPPVVPRSSGCAFEALIRSVFVEDPDWAVMVAMRESGCQPTARNPSGASGLFQMMMPMHTASFAAVGCTPDQWPDPVCNVNAAHLLYLGSGRAPWAF